MLQYVTLYSGSIASNAETLLTSADVVSPAIDVCISKSSWLWMQIAAAVM